MNELQVYRDKIYSINNNFVRTITEHMNEETGEVSNDVLEELNKLEIKKEELTDCIALSHFDYVALEKAIKEDPIVQEAKRRLELASRYSKTAESLKILLAKVVPEGEKFSTPYYSISWRKSTAVELDEDVSLDELPDYCVRIKKELDKTEIKNRNKNGEPLPKGVTVVTKNNIQLK